MYRLFGNMILIATLVWTNVACACSAEMPVDPDPSGGAHAHHEMSAAVPCDHDDCDSCAAVSAAKIIEHKLVGSTKVIDDDALQSDGDALGFYEIPALSIPPPAADPPGHQVLASIAETPITRHDTLLE
jgi:hypothetical protein